MGRFSLKDLGQPVLLRGAREYLIQHGWQVVDEENRVVCKGPSDDSGRPIVQILPPHESYADCGLRLEDLIAALAALEDRPAVEIAWEMSRGDQTTSLAQELIDGYTQLRLQPPPGRDPDEAFRQLRELAHSVQIAMAPHPLNPIREVAMLAARFPRLAASGDASRLYLGWACQRAFAAGGITLRLSPTECDELFAIACADSPDEPTNVFKWLNTRARTANVTAPTAKHQGGAASAVGRPDTQRDSGGPAD